MRRFLPLAVTLLYVGVAFGVPGVVHAERAWRLDVSPSTIFINTETNIRLTVTNTGDDSGGDEISCVRVQVPSSFEISDVKVVSVHGQTSGSAYDAWLPVWTGGSVVAFKNPEDDDPLVGSTPPIDEAVFRVTGRSSSLLAMTWTVTAADKPDEADTTKCGSGATTKTPTILVIPLALPTPTPAPTPTPTPTPTSTPTPTPKPTPTPTPRPTPRPTPTPAPTPTRPPIIVLPTLLPLPTLPPLFPEPTPTTPPESVPPSAEPSGSPAPSASPLATRTPATPSPDPGAGGSGEEPTDGPDDGFTVPGGDQSGAGAAPLEGMEETAVSVLQQLPGGLLPFAGPAVVLGFPGLLVLVAVAAQALGALSWLPVARRKLGGFGIRSKA